MHSPMVYLVRGIIDFGVESEENSVKIARWIERLSEDYGDEQWTLTGNDEGGSLVKSKYSLMLGRLLAGCASPKKKN